VSFGCTGAAVVWDLKNNREAISVFAPTARPALSSVAWHPTSATALATASEDDGDPALFIWDLRHARYSARVGQSIGIGTECMCVCVREREVSRGGHRQRGRWRSCATHGALCAYRSKHRHGHRVYVCVWDDASASARHDPPVPLTLGRGRGLRRSAPERVLRGHDKGILSLVWCGRDPSLLLTGGRDGRALLWSATAQAGSECMGDVTSTGSWLFDVQVCERERK
jgi:WD40 repeat protein